MKKSINTELIHVFSNLQRYYNALIHIYPLDKKMLDKVSSYNFGDDVKDNIKMAVEVSDFVSDHHIDEFTVEFGTYKEFVEEFKTVAKSKKEILNHAQKIRMHEKKFKDLNSKFETLHDRVKVKKEMTSRRLLHKDGVASYRCYEQLEKAISIHAGFCDATYKLLKSVKIKDRLQDALK